MDKIMIDGSQIGSRKELFEKIRAQIGDHKLIGSNLDALHDALTSITSYTVIEIYRQDLLSESLGDYWKRVLWVINDCLDENNSLDILSHPGHL